MDGQAPSSPAAAGAVAPDAPGGAVEAGDVSPGGLWPSATVGRLSSEHGGCMPARPPPARPEGALPERAERGKVYPIAGPHSRGAFGVRHGKAAPHSRAASLLLLLVLQRLQRVGLLPDEALGDALLD